MSKFIDKKLSEIVEHELFKDKLCRDSDSYLILQVFEQYGLVLTPKQRFQFGFHVPPAEAITRARRKLQEQNPLLRGEKYIARQRRQKQVKKELGYK